jgi:hypothetical protein
MKHKQADWVSDVMHQVQLNWESQIRSNQPNLYIYLNLAAIRERHIHREKEEVVPTALNIPRSLKNPREQVRSSLADWYQQVLRTRYTLNPFHY